MPVHPAAGDGDAHDPSIEVIDTTPDPGDPADQERIAQGHADARAVHRQTASDDLAAAHTKVAQAEKDLAAAQEAVAVAEAALAALDKE